MNNRDFDFRSIQEKFQKVLGDDFLSEMNKFIPKKGPAIDVFETDTHVYVVVELPGLTSDEQNVKIRLVGLLLIIEGEVANSYPVKKLIQAERFFGYFKREIQLPFSIQEKGIHATYKRGLVVISIPKKEMNEEDHVKINFEED